MTILHNMKRLLILTFIAIFCVFGGANAGFAATYDVKYKCGDGTGDAPAPTTATSESSFTPAANTCIAPTDYTFAGWTVSGTNDTVFDTFTWNYTEPKNLIATYRPAYFTVTTIPLTSGDVFKFNISAAGTFNVDCGTDGVLSGDGVSGTTITRANTTSTTYTCTYSSEGAKNIKFTGTATAYSTGTTDTDSAILFGGSTNDLTPSLIASMSGSVGGVFPTLGQSSAQKPIFRSFCSGCTYLKSIPTTLFSGITSSVSNMFAWAFYNCTSLTSIPAELFDGITIGASHMFKNTFEKCSSLTTIPDGLFSRITTGADYMFEATFRKCSSLTTIPDGLFSQITTGADHMFYDTFAYCESLTALPENLFSGITTAAPFMFQSTFNYCSNLSGYIPASTFTGLVVNGSPQNQNMWHGDTFDHTKIVTVCPAGTQQYITGYEGYTINSTWNGHVSCEPSNLSCTGATFATNNQCTPCPTGYTSDTTDGKTTQSQCKISCAAGTYIAAAGDTTCTTVEIGYYIGAKDFKYGEYNKRNGCGTGRTTLSTGSTSADACVCDGARYMSNGICVDCPGGYTANTTPGKTAVEQCQIHCDAGTWLSNMGNVSCSNVGIGHYAGASDVYYGQIGTRDTCGDGLITATDTSTSINDCIASTSPCTGASYWDGSQCVDCPSGYDYNDDDGKVSIHQCQISCAAGTYVKTAVHEYTLLEYLENTGTSYIDTGHTHKSENIRGELRIGSPSTGALSGNVNFLGTQRNSGAGYSFGWNKGFKMWVESAGNNITGANYAVAKGATVDVAYNLTGTTRRIEWPTNQHKDGAHTGLGNQSSLWLFNAKDQSDRFFKGKIYYFRLYENGELIYELLPARRNSDNALGMFDTLSETFIEATVRNNSMTGGPEINSDCVGVGKGYYAPASVTDYGSIGSKFACPAGTYQGTENGTSLASCLPCTGATYSDSTASAACTACPTGYEYNTTSNKTSAKQCQALCAAGTYVAPEYTELEYIEASEVQYLDTIILTSTYVNPIVTITKEYNSLTGYSGDGTTDINIVTNNDGTKFKIKAGDDEVILGDADTNKHTFVIDMLNGTASMDETSVALPTGALGAKAFWIGKINGINGGYVNGKYYNVNIVSNGNVMFNLIPVRRDSDRKIGMLNTITNVFYPSATARSFVAGPNTENASGTAGCINAEAGYYAPQSSIVNYGNISPANARVACPVGTYSDTVGATSASTCTSCAGATYNDETGMAACKACPAGYTYNTTNGKDEITDCQIHCEAGTYASTTTASLKTGYTALEYIQTTGSQYIDTGVAMNTLVNPTMSLTMQYDNLNKSQQNGVDNGVQFKVGIPLDSSTFFCQTGSSSVAFGAADTDKHTFVLDTTNSTCSLDDVSLQITVPSYSNVSQTFYIGKTNNQNKFDNAKYYHFSITSNGVLVRDMVPAKRDSDDAVGMYDLVNDVFYTNNGGGTIYAGPAITVGGCVNVGTGYWAAASTINYGTLGTRNACPIGTYSGITNGASASACQSCTGATYADETGMASCKACPTGYDYNTTAGKDEITDCQISCAAGTSVKTDIPLDTYRPLEYIESTGSQYINTGIKPNQLTNPIVSFTTQYTEVAANKYSGSWSGPKKFFMGIDSSQNFFIQIGTSSATTFGSADTNKHTFVIDIANQTASLDNTTSSLEITDWKHGTPLYINREDTDNSRIGKMKIYHFNIISNGVEFMNLVPVRRLSDGVLGMYDTVGGGFYTNAGSGEFLAGGFSGDMLSCTDVGTGHWIAANIVNYGSVSSAANICPIGTYSDIPNASSCQSCVGATYNDTPGAASCKACPTGYDYNTTNGKDEITDCQIHCDAGTYAGSLVPGGYTELEYVQTTGTQYINTGVAINTLVNPTMSLTMQYDSTGTNQQNGLFSNSINFKVGISASASNFMCQAGGDNTDVQFGPADTNKHTFVLDTANATCSLDNNTLPITVGDLSTMSSTEYFQIGARNNGSAKNNAKYYRFSMTNDGVLIRDMVPAKRDSDDAVGMYDLVNGVFYPNSGTGDIVAGRVVGGAGCNNVGTGYWATASTINYGTLGTRTACPVGTYSPIETGASAAACLSCTGATYGDETAAAACKSCPVNYDYNTTSGKTAENQCQTHCDAGTYVSTVIPDAYTQLEYIESTGTQYINTGLTLNNLTNPVISLDMQYTNTNTNQRSGFSYASDVGYSSIRIGIVDGKFNFMAVSPSQTNLATLFGDADTNRHTFTLNTQNNTASLDSNVKPITVQFYTNGNGTSFYIGAVHSQYGEAQNYNFSSAKYYRFNLISNGVEIRNMIPVRRNLDNVAGMYDTINNVFYQSAGTDAFIAGPATACVAAGYGHYSAAATVDYGSTNANTLGACPIGKYSDILNGTSVSVCQSCTGATYANTTGMKNCTACPTYYDYNTTSGKTAVNQCQIHCDAGTYLMNPVNLPSGYTQLPYIEATGTQYIDTKVQASSLTNPIMSQTIQYTEVQSHRQSGAEGSIEDTWYFFLLGINENTKFACQAGGSGTQTVLGDPDTNMHTFVLNTANATCSLDGVSSPLTVGTLPNSTIKVGASRSDRKSKAKLYNFNLISNGVEIMNLVPAKRDADDAIGMYDTIGNAFYPNAGTGTFVAPQTGCTGVESGYYAAASTANYGATYVDTHNACPVGYDYSAAGVAGAQTDCYAMCTVSDVPHATAFTGGNYYGGNTTCAPLDANSCDTGYRYVAANGNNLPYCDANSANEITINWGDANGGVWATTQCEYGGTITTPTTAPTKRGHTFIGWRFVAPTPEPEQTPVDPGE